MLSMSEKELIEGAKKRNAKCQRALFDRYSPVLMGLCLRYCRNRAEAEDALQESFIRIFDKLDLYDYKGSFEGWLKRIAINTCLQRYKNSIGVYDIVNEGNIEDVSVDVNDDDLSIDFLLKIIQQLPDRYRLIFNLYVLDGYSHIEISELLGISTGTSKSNLSRARLILKDKIEAYKATINSQSL